MVIITISVDDSQEETNVEVGLLGKKANGISPNAVEVLRYLHVAEGRMMGILSSHITSKPEKGEG